MKLFSEECSLTAFGGQSSGDVNVFPASVPELQKDFPELSISEPVVPYLSITLQAEVCVLCLAARSGLTSAWLLPPEVSHTPLSSKFG